ncbi:hypothetical protein [Rhodococcus sp. 077-4]
MDALRLGRARVVGDGPTNGELLVGRASPGLWWALLLAAIQW